MKTDSAARRAPPELSNDAFRAFFEAIEQPAALCDPQLRLLVANPAFELLVGVRGPGIGLGELLVGVAGHVPADGSVIDVEVQCLSGQAVTLTLSRRGDTVAVMARNLSQAAAGGTLAAAGRALIEQARIESALLDLGRNMVGATSEEALVAAVARGVKGLYPGRTFCLRVVDPKTLELTSLYAEGRLKVDAPEVLMLKRSAAVKTQLNLGGLPGGKLKIVDEEVPHLFESSVRSICAPLVSSGQLFGLINVEYPEGLTADLVTDDRVLIQLANQVAVAVRNAKLIDELSFIRKYLEELLEHANALILVANADRRIMVFNRQLSRLTGFSKQEVLGKDVLSFVPESERLRVMRVLAASQKGESVSGVETRLICRDGHEARVSFATSAMMAGHQEVAGVIAIGADLTAVKELEQQVIQAEKLASLGQLAASVVHEINNPMTAISAYADSLLQKSLATRGSDPADQEKLKKVLDNSKRILNFTRDLVSYARPASPDKLVDTDVHQALETAVSFCDHVLHQHGVRVEKTYVALPPVRAVPGHLVQVFVNLITNACHASRAGGAIRLETRLDGDDIRIDVADAGSGIAEKHLARIFDPFFTTKPEGKGTGLGLSIVHNIVERHGGDISVQSELGAGTTFSISLPAAPRE